MSASEIHPIEARQSDRSLLRAAVITGIGLGGLVDGIVFHQILQWHHMLSRAGYSPTTLITSHNLEIDTYWDGIFHVGSLLCLVIGLGLLWRARAGASQAKTTLLNILAGFGLFNLVEGTIDHLLLGVHHVNEKVPNSEWLAWDSGFVIVSAAMMIPAIWISVSQRRSTASKSRATGNSGPNNKLKINSGG